MPEQNDPKKDDQKKDEPKAPAAGAEVRKPTEPGKPESAEVKPSKPETEKQPAPSPAPSVDVNRELDKMAELVITELDELATKAGLTVEDVRSQFVARIRHVRRVAAAPNRFSSGAAFAEPQARR